MEEGTGRTVIADGPILDHGRDTFGTSPLDAVPDEILRMPEDTVWPFFLALSVLVLAYGLLTGLAWLGIVGGIALFITIVGWFLPSHEPGPTVRA